MIHSKYILDILDLIFDEFESEGLLRQQIPFLSENNREHTGVGTFIYFVADKKIENYKISTDKARNFDPDGNPTEMLNGVEIRNNGLNILADATVHIKNGFIDCIEIWNKNGEDYPIEDPPSYELTQSWRDISNKRTIGK